MSSGKKWEMCIRDREKRAQVYKVIGDVRRKQGQTEAAFQNYLEALRQNGSGFVRTELSRIFLTDLYEGSKRAAVYAKAGDASEFLNQWLGKYGSIEAVSYTHLDVYKRQDDERIRFSLDVAKKEGLEIQIETGELENTHPNTAEITLTAADGEKVSLRGGSIGGGNILILSLIHICGTVIHLVFCDLSCYYKSVSIF